MHTLFLLLIGIALLLGGLNLLRANLQNLWGTSFQRLLTRLTLTPWRGFLLGITAAALFQSSSAVSLLTIALTSAGCLTFRQGLSLILGANIGTCSTVQVLAVAGTNQSLDILLMLLSLSLGLALIPKLRTLSLSFCCLCMMLLGISVLALGFNSLAEMDTLIQYLSLAERQPIYGIMGGILLTAVLNSSSAATGILMLVADDGMLPLTAAMYVIYGNNIGSCVSSLVVGLHSPPEAKQVALSHILLNIMGTLLFFPFTHMLSSIIASIANDFALQVALAHTVFNVLSSLIALPLIPQFTWLITRLVPSGKMVSCYTKNF